MGEIAKQVDKKKKRKTKGDFRGKKQTNRGNKQR